MPVAHACATAGRSAGATRAMAGGDQGILRRVDEHRGIRGVAAAAGRPGPRTGRSARRARRRRRSACRPGPTSMRPLAGWLALTVSGSPSASLASTAKDRMASSAVTMHMFCASGGVLVCPAAGGASACATMSAPPRRGPYPVPARRIAHRASRSPSALVSTAAALHLPFRRCVYLTLTYAALIMGTMQLYAGPPASPESEFRPLADRRP